MAYQNVGTPRFYINVLEWMDSSGILNGLDNIYRTLPVSPTNWRPYWDVAPSGSSSTLGFSGNLGFIAILGHTMNTHGAGFTIRDLTSQTYLASGTSAAGVDAIAINYGGVDSSPDYDGFTIASVTDDFNELGSVYLHVNSSTNIGSIVIGTYYDMPHSPDLSLTMSREYGGTKEFTTYNGSSMSNTMWSSTPQWGNLGAWELGDSNPALSKSGRRSWDLTFSYMDDGDLWGSNPHLGTGEWGIQDSSLYGDDLHTESGNVGQFLYDIITDDNFFSQVWHKTLGGTLPFIFQPDNSNFNPDQFAICRFKDNSLKATQSAFNVYDISLSIEEVW